MTNLFNILIFIILSTLSLSLYSGNEIGGGGAKAVTLSNNIDLLTSTMKFNVNKISEIQLANGAFISSKKAAAIFTNAQIIKETLLINTSSKDIFDVQMKDGRTCVILDNNCY